MKTAICLALLASGSVVPCRAFSHSDRWPVQEQETIQKVLTLSAPPMRLVVDNIDGYVHVTAASGSDVRVTAHKKIRAETDSDLQQAKSEVRLEMTEKPGTASIYYDAPWRCNGEGGGCHDRQRRFYNVIYDIDVQTPRNARIVVSTVNNGDVRVEGTAGDFDIGNVNGQITLTAIAGSGDVHTVNGPVTVRFARNPSASSSFKTINGQLDLYFQPGLSADLLFKTFNGEIYSDFDVAPRVVAESAGGEHDGKFVYRSNRGGSGRVGNGGPQLSFETLNGNVRLHREQ
ncbi:MAG TPA: hypothetical protein VH601_00185 [Bryobacteraceae bacterium]|jgi:hypothetical protein